MSNLEASFERRDKTLFLNVAFDLLIDSSIPRIKYRLPIEINPASIQFVESVINGKELLFLIETGNNFCGFQFDDKRRAIFKVRMNGHMLVFPLSDSERDNVWKMIESAPALMK